MSETPASAGGLITGPASTIDGDSINVGGYELRLHGVDAPEWKQLCERGGQRYRCGNTAARALADKIDGRHLECHVRDVDRYGRGVAACFLGGEDLNGWLVRRDTLSPIGGTLVPMWTRNRLPGQRGAAYGPGTS